MTEPWVRDGGGPPVNTPDAVGRAAAAHPVGRAGVAPAGSWSVAPDAAAGQAGHRYGPAPVGGAPVPPGAVSSVPMAASAPPVSAPPPMQPGPPAPHPAPLPAAQPAPPAGTYASASRRHAVSAPRRLRHPGSVVPPL